VRFLLDHDVPDDIAGAPGSRFSRLRRRLPPRVHPELHEM
jgi:hypothetical protein